MAHYQRFARLARWAGRSLAHNLSFLPEDRLHWEPAPGTKTAAAIVAEVTGQLQGVIPLLRGGAWMEVKAAPPASLEEARRMVLEAVSDYANALDRADPGALEHPVETPVGPLNAAQEVLAPLVDLIHHHGQICYLQSLAGDLEYHLDFGAVRDGFG
jgi:hypothetical protein